MKCVTCTFCRFFVLKITKGGFPYTFCTMKKIKRKDKAKVCKLFYPVDDSYLGLKIPDYCVYCHVRNRNIFSL